MNLIARRLIAFAIGILLVAFGLYKIVMLMAFSGGFPMPSSTRANLIAFATDTPNWQRYLLYALFAALPIIYVELWRRARKSNRLIRVADGLFIRESAVSDFLADAVTALEEVRAFRAKCRMIKGKGLALDCRVELESQRQLSEVRDRVVSAVRACMAERMAVIPVAHVDVTVQGQRAETSTQSIAQRAAVTATGTAVSPASPTPAPPAPAAVEEEPLRRQSINLAPIEHDEGDAEDDDDDSSPLSLGSSLGHALLDDEGKRRRAERDESPLSE